MKLKKEGMARRGRFVLNLPLVPFIFKGLERNKISLKVTFICLINLSFF